MAIFNCLSRASKVAIEEDIKNVKKSIEETRLYLEKHPKEDSLALEIIQDYTEKEKVFVTRAGEYLAVLRSWIQRTFRNGEHVTWGSNDALESYKTLTPYLLEILAMDIRDAVIRQFKIKDLDHEYKYRVCCLGKGKFMQFADTAQEVWNVLFNLEGSVIISRNKEAVSISEILFHGSVEKAKIWCDTEGRKVLV